MGDFRRTLQPSQGAEMAAQGRTIYIKDATAPIQVVFDGSERFLMSQGDKLTRAQTFAGFRIENPRDELLDATITVTDGDYAQRAISGEVTIDDRRPLSVVGSRDDGGFDVGLANVFSTARTQIETVVKGAIESGFEQRKAGAATANADAIAERALRIGEVADSEAERIAEAVAVAVSDRSRTAYGERFRAIYYRFENQPNFTAIANNTGKTVYIAEMGLSARLVSGSYGMNAELFTCSARSDGEPVINADTGELFSGIQVINQSANVTDLARAFVASGYEQQIITPRATIALPPGRAIGVRQTDQNAKWMITATILTDARDAYV